MRSISASRLRSATVTTFRWDKTEVIGDSITIDSDARVHDILAQKGQHTILGQFWISLADVLPDYMRVISVSGLAG